MPPANDYLQCPHCNTKMLCPDAHLPEPTKGQRRTARDSWSLQAVCIHCSQGFRATRRENTDFGNRIPGPRPPKVGSDLLSGNIRMRPARLCSSSTDCRRENRKKELSRTCCGRSSHLSAIWLCSRTPDGTRRHVTFGSGVVFHLLKRRRLRTSIRHDKIGATNYLRR